MTQLVLRGLMERRLRSVLTALATVLGVAMISGTFVQTDAINHAFSQIENTAYKGVAAAVTPRTSFHSQFAEPKPFSATLVDRIRALPGVRRAEGDLDESGQLVVHGKVLNNTFAPSLVISTAGARSAQIALEHGRMPSAPGEIVIDANTATKHHVAVGETVGVAARRGVQQVRVVGTVTFGGGTSVGGATLIFAALSDVQRWYGAEGKVTSVPVGSAAGVAPKQLVHEIRPLLGGGLQVRTGQAQASTETKDITGAIGGFLTPLLLALAGAALLVGAFIIFNTFSITVAQRNREFALLRSLGASRRQVLGAVAGERSCSASSRRRSDWSAASASQSSSAPCSMRRGSASPAAAWCSTPGRSWWHSPSVSWSRSRPRSGRPFGRRGSHRSPRCRAPNRSRGDARAPHRLSPVG